MSKFHLPTDIWYGEGELEIELPEKWDVTVYDMEGSNSPVLTSKEIKERIDDPIGTETIRRGARGSHSAVILFDDMTRPTRVSRIAPIVLKELRKSGVPKNSIRFVMAQGAHRVHTRYDYVKKLGEDIVDQYPVFGHSPFHNCVTLGTTSFGTPVEINGEVMNCDYKIGIGGIIPHFRMGFGGGGKILVPGVASIETIRKNHYLSVGPDGTIKRGAGWGCYDFNEHRLDMEEATRMAGLDFKIDALFNYRGEITNIFAGDPIKEHHKGVKKAGKYYKTERAKHMDVVIANAYCKATEAGLAALQATDSLDESGGDCVIVTNTPEGQAPHYLYGHWGVARELSRIGGLSSNEKKTLPMKVKKIIIFTKYIDRGGSWWFGPEDMLKWVKRWDKVVDLIGREPKKAALYPDATIQLIK